MKRWFVSGAVFLALAFSLPAQKPKSKKEAEAVRAMLSAPDPDSRIAAADNVLNQFADTEYKAIALMVLAQSYQDKGDTLKSMVYAEQALDANPKDYNSMLMLANGYAGKTRENDLDKDEKLTKATKYANDALKTLETAEKPGANVTDEQWTAEKKQSTGIAHAALGMVAMVQKKYDVAVTEFKTAVDVEPEADSPTMVRLAIAYNATNQPDEALAMIEKINAMPNLPTSVKQIAQAERVRALMKKNAGKGLATGTGTTPAAPATPPAPPASPNATPKP